MSSPSAAWKARRCINEHIQIYVLFCVLACLPIKRNHVFWRNSLFSVWSRKNTMNLEILA